MEENPLFGEEKGSDKLIFWGSASIITLFVIYCSIIGVVLGVLEELYQHVMLVAVMLSLCIMIILLTRWYRGGDDQLTKKYFWFLIGLVIVVFLLGITINAYVWVLDTSCEDQPDCPSGLYLTEPRKLCITPASTITNCLAVGRCISLNIGTTTATAFCQNCTSSLSYSYHNRMPSLEEVMALNKLQLSD
eukprot:TRINITY_DN6861_c0_g2_i1.p1 TRINITY_DN6861_c0_g2~~TRINITY_DN6861_c0_g2_i1.p1  ORF type:complete len:190 (-),score=14.09 TRINITY_DN6861_c0_g2_i1:221-790(-)